MSSEQNLPSNDMLDTRLLFSIQKVYLVCDAIDFDQETKLQSCLHPHPRSLCTYICYIMFEYISFTRVYACFVSSLEQRMFQIK